MERQADKGRYRMTGDRLKDKITQLEERNQELKAQVDRLSQQQILQQQKQSKRQPHSQHSQHSQHPQMPGSPYLEAPPSSASAPKRGGRATARGAGRGADRSRSAPRSGRRPQQRNAAAAAAARAPEIGLDDDGFGAGSGGDAGAPPLGGFAGGVEDFEGIEGGVGDDHMLRHDDDMGWSLGADAGTAAARGGVGGGGSGGKGHANPVTQAGFRSEYAELERMQERMRFDEDGGGGGGGGGGFGGGGDDDDEDNDGVGDFGAANGGRQEDGLGFDDNESNTHQVAIIPVT